MSLYFLTAPSLSLLLLFPTTFSIYFLSPLLNPLSFFTFSIHFFSPLYLPTFLHFISVCLLYFLTVLISLLSRYTFFQSSLHFLSFFLLHLPCPLPHFTFFLLYTLNLCFLSSLSLSTIPFPFFPISIFDFSICFSHYFLNSFSFFTFPFVFYCTYFSFC